jgi:hypothetical protein
LSIGLKVRFAAHVYGNTGGIFLLKYGNREYGWETASPVPVPIPAGFLFFSYFSCKNGTRPANAGYSVGRYRIFPFPLSSLVLPPCPLDLHKLWHRPVNDSEGGEGETSSCLSSSTGAQQQMMGEGSGPDLEAYPRRFHAWDNQPLVDADPDMHTLMERELDRPGLSSGSGDDGREIYARSPELVW